MRVLLPKQFFIVCCTENENYPLPDPLHPAGTVASGKHQTRRMSGLPLYPRSPRLSQTVHQQATCIRVSGTLLPLKLLCGGSGLAGEPERLAGATRQLARHTLTLVNFALDSGSLPSLIKHAQTT